MFRNLIRKVFLRKEIISKKGELHFRRWGIDAFIFGIYIHQIYKPDEDKHLHDHPWDYISFCLKGSFMEEGEKYVSIIKSGSFIIRKANKFHKIKEVIEPSTTLFITTSRRRRWGYNVNGRWVEGERYHKIKNTIID